MFQVQFHSHACISIEVEDQILLTDPWFDGEVFNNSWALRVKPDLARIDFDRVRWVWVSHEHPDHFHLPSLRAVRDRVRGPLTLLYRKQKNSNVKRAAEALGYRVIELEAGVTTPAWGNVSLTSFPFRTDTMLVVEADGRVLLNQNDCQPDADAVEFIRARFPNIDAWLFYFSIAGYHGNQDDKEQLALARQMRLEQLTHYYHVFRPRIFVPFASFIVFCRQANDYLNNWTVSIDDVLEHCSALPVQILWGGDTLLWEQWEVRNEVNAERWRAVWKRPREPRPPRPISNGELSRAGAALADEVEVYPMRLRSGAPGECQVLVRDSGRGALIDLRGARFRLLERPDEERIVAELDAEDLLFLLRFPWGADTLFISSCFAARDIARWSQLLAFRQAMYTTPLTNFDRVEMAFKRIVRSLARMPLLRKISSRSMPVAASD